MTTSRHETIIESSRGWLHVPWREWWDYRDLLVLMVQRDLTSRYKQTILGPLWFLLQPVLTTLLFAVFFGHVAGISTDAIPAPLFYLCGLLGWNYFSQTLTTGGAIFVHNAHLFGKVYFPRLIVPIATAIANLISFALQFVPFLAFFLYFKFRPEASSFHPDWRLILLPLVSLHMIALSLGVSLWMSALTAKYRDLVHLNQYLVQMWMFATPVIWPLSKLPDSWRWLVWANPMAVPVESFRICLLGRGELSIPEIAISATIALALLFSGIVAFHHVEGSVVDTV